MYVCFYSPFLGGVLAGAFVHFEWLMTAVTVSGAISNTQKCALGVRSRIRKSIFISRNKPVGHID